MPPAKKDKPSYANAAEKAGTGPKAFRPPKRTPKSGGTEKKPEDEEMEVDKVAPPPETAWMVIVSGGNIPKEVCRHITDLAVDARAYGLFRSPNEECESRLASLVTKAFAPGKAPMSEEMGSFVRWMRTGAGLLKNPEGEYRNDGSDVVVFAHPRAFWPPVLGEGAKTGWRWEFSRPGLTEDEAKAVLGLLDPNGSWGAKFVYRLVDSAGGKLHKFAVMCPTAPENVARDFELEGVTLKFVASCSFCKRGGILHPVHTTDDCSLLGMVNKLRDNQGLNPLRVSVDSVEWVTGRKAFEAEPLVEALKKRVEDLEKRVKVLEAAKAPQNNNNGKKRKAPPAENAPPKKKSNVENKGENKKGKGKKKQN
ncbi:hypothetical protein RSOL_393640, partial [Rhizoctonia solani AG-3 Rhs1AP]